MEKSDELEAAAAGIIENAGENLGGTERIVEAAVREAELPGFAGKFGIALGVVAGQALLIRLVWFLFKKLSANIKAGAGNRIKPLTIKNLKVLNASQIVNIILFFIKLAKYLITVFQLFITVPIVFSLFPATKELASTIFGYFLTPLGKILTAMLKYIPNIITIIIIILIAKYVLRAIRFFANQIARGKLVIPGFYTDWAWPTYNILKIFLYAFTAALVYPYLPGSQSRAFQGMSVFWELSFHLGQAPQSGILSRDL